MSHNVYSIDHTACSSRLRYVPTRYKLGFALASMGLCLASAGLFAPVFIAAASGAVCVLFGGTDFRLYLKLLTVPAVFLLLGTAAAAVGISSEPYGQYMLRLGGLYIYTSTNSIFGAARAALRALGAVGSLYTATLTTPLGDIVSALEKARVPKLITELMTMIYRFIFILTEVYVQLRTAAESRLGYRDRKTALRTFALTAANLFVIALHRSGAYYDALESRGYTGELRFLGEEKRLLPKHVIVAAAYLICAAAVVFTERRILWTI